MALARLGGARRPDSYTWPGFVDALATLLMVIIFVVLVFVLIQVNLAYRVSGQDATLNDMRAQIANLGELLNIERKQSADLSAELDPCMRLRLLGVPGLPWAPPCVGTAPPLQPRRRRCDGGPRRSAGRGGRGRRQ